MQDEHHRDFRQFALDVRSLRELVRAHRLRALPEVIHDLHRRVQTFLVPGLPPVLHADIIDIRDELSIFLQLVEAVGSSGLMRFQLARFLKSVRRVERLTARVDATLSQDPNAGAGKQTQRVELLEEAERHRTPAAALISDTNGVKLPPSHRSAYEGFIEARKADSDLDTAHPTPQQHAWLREYRPGLLKGKAAQNADTWCAYARKALLKLEGRKRGARPDPSRSMVRTDSADSRTLS